MILPPPPLFLLLEVVLVPKSVLVIGIIPLPSRLAQAVDVVFVGEHDVLPLLYGQFNMILGKLASDRHMILGQRW